jgi:lipopolysaccharide transport system ATP-binding protein
MDGVPDSVRPHLIAWVQTIPDAETAVWKRAMSDPAIRVVSLGKVFRVWRHPSDMLKEALGGRQRHSEFEALRDVSLDVPRGSVVGIMGRNGAGKSTLLRIIAGTLDATSGSVSVAGRISAILELGTGFHPDYSGRDNVFLGGLCLGLTRAEIAARLDEIVGFAELEEFIDQPFRTYSSGMQARLTFAVATAVDADILIIDEALAVGDARFQLKSFDRVRQFSRQGKSILLVSHSINQVVSICDHAILLEKGRLLAQGAPRAVGNIYHELLFGPPDTAVPAQGSRAHEPALVTSDVTTSSELSPLQAKASDADPDAVPSLPNGMQVAEGKDSAAATNSIIAAKQTDDPTICEDPPAEKPDILTLNGAGSRKISREHRYGDGAVRIVDFFLRKPNGPRVSTVTSLQRYEFMMHLQAITDVTRLCAGILVRTHRGIEIFGAHSPLLLNLPSIDMARGTLLQVRIPFLANLGHGTYFASSVVANSDSVKHDVRFDALEFTVDQTGYHDSSLTNLDARFIYEELVDTEHRFETQSPTQ